jgi:hypothetical protein
MSAPMFQIDLAKRRGCLHKIFSSKGNARRRKNIIPSLTRSNGEIIWSHEEKEEEITRHFLSTLWAREQRTLNFNWDDLELEVVHMGGLDATFSEEEIWAAICQMPSEKAPGPDGFTGTFYKVCWPIKVDVVNAFSCIFNLHIGPLASSMAHVLRCYQRT